MRPKSQPSHKCFGTKVADVRISEHAVQPRSTLRSSTSDYLTGCAGCALLYVVNLSKLANVAQIFRHEGYQDTNF